MKKATSTDVEVAASYPDPAKVVNGGSYTKEQIFDIDKTALHHKMISSRTFIAGKEESMLGFKAPKTG